jgi:hypothetical protein
MQQKCLDRGAIYRGGFPGSPDATQPPPRDRSAPGERCLSLGPVRAGAPQRGHSAADGACAHSKFPFRWKTGRAMDITPMAGLDPERTSGNRVSAPDRCSSGQFLWTARRISGVGGTADLA